MFHPIVGVWRRALQLALQLLWIIIDVIVATGRAALLQSRRCFSSSDRKHDDGVVFADIRRDEGLRRARMLQQLDLFSSGKQKHGIAVSAAIFELAWVFGVHFWASHGVQRERALSAPPSRASSM